MKKKNAVNNAKSNARSNQPAQTAPTTTVITKAQEMTAEEAELQFRFRVYLFISLLKQLSKCNDRERQQLACFIDACSDRLHKAMSSWLVKAWSSPHHANSMERERAVQFATFEKMGRMIQRRKHA